jgi:hypothetical protein
MSQNERKSTLTQIPLFEEAVLAAGTGSAVIPREVPAPPDHDGRSTAVWRQWLSSMASDAEAALSAAIAYREMDGAGREQWLTSLEFDAPEVKVPRVALYAPLLAVEQDPERRTRLLFALGDDATQPLATTRQLALLGEANDGTRIYVVSTPLYLQFSQVLACGVRRGIFLWVRHDPIVGPEGIPRAGQELEGVSLMKAPMKAVLDELASAVLSHQRSGRTLPEALSVLGDLLGPLGP